MSKTKILSIVIAIATTASMAFAGRLANSNFETDFEVTDGTLYHWGKTGELFGGAHQVNAGDAGVPAKTSDGKRCICIDLGSNSWSGIWQQVDGGPGKAYLFKAHYMIQGGALPDSAATFMKVEFYKDDGMLSGVEGEWHRSDTKGQWVEDQMKGTTPDGTKMVRFVLIAGDNSEGAVVKNRIFWDNVEAQ